jgi:tetratricopeptide (TPR) repeat protein
MSNEESHPSSKYMASHLPCGRCRYDMGEVKIWRLVFAHDSPQLTGQVLDGSINTIECPRCRNAAPAFAPFLYADLDNLRAVFVPTPGLSEVENAEEKRLLLEIASETLDAGRREKLASRLQEAFNYLYISGELEKSDEEVESFNRDYADYLEWEGLPAVGKIEKIIEAALAGRTFILSDSELDGVFGSALAHLLEEAEKNKQEERVSVLKQLSERLEEVRAHEEQGKAGPQSPSYSLDLPEPSQVWELVRNATHVMNASDINLKRPAPEAAAAPGAPKRPADGDAGEDAAGDKVDGEVFALNLREMARAKGELEMEGNLSCMLGEIYQGRGLTWRAVGCFERALRIGEKLNDDRLKGMALGGLGTAYIAKGQVDRGIADIQTAMKFSVLAKDYRAYAVLVERLGRAKRSIGHFDTAKQCFESALNMYRKFRDQAGSDQKKEVAWCLYQLGQLCIELGEFEEAKAHLLEALSAYEGKGGSMESGVLSYLGICCLRMGEPIGADLRSYVINDADGTSSLLMERVPSSEGIKYLERALELAGNPHDRMAILTNLSSVNLSTGYYHRAIRYYEEILEILRSGGESRVEAYHLANLAQIWMEKLKAHKEEGDEDAAKEAGRKALEYYKAAASLSTEGSVAGGPETFPFITQLAYCAELVGDYEEALKWYRYITGFTEGRRVSFKDAKHKEFFHQTSIRTFVRASRCALRVAGASPEGGGGLINEAFYYAEAAKCRLLTDTFNDAPEPYDTTDESFVSRLPEDLKHVVQFVSEAPVGFHPAGVGEVVKTLDAGTALLEYSMTQHMGDDKGFWTLFAALPGSPDIRLLHRADLEEVWGAREEFYKIVESLENALESAGDNADVEEALARSRPSYEAALLSLGRLLLPEEVVAELGALCIRRLVVVPEAYLFDVPWSALRVSAGGKTVPLIGDGGGGGFEVVVAPSASVFVQCHQRTAKRAGDMAGKRPRALLFGGPEVNVNSDFSGFVGDVIGRDILSNRFETRHFYDDSASPESLLDNVPSSSLCFFYGHASYDFEDPLESHLTISSGGGDGRYKLTAREILSYHANRAWSSCALFVMASCEGQRTDYTHMWEAREIIGLSTAMFQCGVSGVIGSLWRIRVATVCRLYPQFFLSYASGRPASESLREAQLGLQGRDDFYSHPHLWGGVYLMGDYGAGVANGD